MKPSILYAFAALAVTSSATQCFYDTSAQMYYVESDPLDVGLIPGLCGGLWDNLKRFGACLVPSRTSCGEDAGKLVWKFEVDRSCNGGDVESTWYEATKNNYGRITCTIP